MIRKFAAAAVIATASLSFVAVAQAEDFPAAPMNHGPMMVHGMGPVSDIANVALTPVNVVAQPFAGEPAAEPMAAPMAKHHHHHHHHHMMK